MRVRARASALENDTCLVDPLAWYTEDKPCDFIEPHLSCEASSNRTTLHVKHNKILKTRHQASHWGLLGQRRQGVHIVGGQKRTMPVRGLHRSSATDLARKIMKFAASPALNLPSTCEAPTVAVPGLQVTADISVSHSCCISRHCTACGARCPQLRWSRRCHS